MNTQEILYENKHFKIVLEGTFYVSQSKENKDIDDSYFTTLNAAKIYIGVIPVDYNANPRYLLQY